MAYEPEDAANSSVYFLKQGISPESCKSSATDMSEAITGKQICACSI
jgi:hypothetical protein